MKMSSLYPCGKPCSTGTHNETVTNLALSPEFDRSNLIVGIAKFGPKKGLVFKSDMSPLTEVLSSSKRAEGNKRLIVISLA